MGRGHLRAWPGRQVPTHCSPPSLAGLGGTPRGSGSQEPARRLLLPGGPGQGGGRGAQGGGRGGGALLPFPSLPSWRRLLPRPAGPGGFASGFISQGPTALLLPSPSPFSAFWSQLQGHRLRAALPLPGHLAADTSPPGLSLNASLGCFLQAAEGKQRSSSSCIHLPESSRPTRQEAQGPQSALKDLGPYLTPPDSTQPSYTGLPARPSASALPLQAFAQTLPTELTPLLHVTSFHSFLSPPSPLIRRK